jgi:nitrite reductase (cytochrome c-552)
MGFHAPQEAARVLGEAIDFARQGQVLLLGGSVASPAGKAESPASSAAPSAGAPSAARPPSASPPPSAVPSGRSH